MALDVRHTFGDSWESHMQLVVTGGLNCIHLQVQNGNHCPGLSQLFRSPVCTPSVALQEERSTGSKAGAIPWEPSQLLAEEQKSLLPSAWGFC